MGDRMLKTLLQLLLLSTALVATAFIEAVVPVWLAERTSTATHIMPSSEYGTMRGYRKCMAESWLDGSKTSSNAMEKACISKIAAYQNDALVIRNLEVDATGACGPQLYTARRFKGTIVNASDNILLTAASWGGSYQTHRKTFSGGGGEKLWLAPGENKNLCLFIIDFEKAAHAKAFDAAPLRLNVNIRVQRGLEQS
jgi:hypothetical protein